MRMLLLLSFWQMDLLSMQIGTLVLRAQLSTNFDAQASSLYEQVRALRLSNNLVMTLGDSAVLMVITAAASSLRRP